MNVTQLIERVRDIVREQPQTATAPTIWTDAELLRHLNSAYHSVWNDARGASEQWGMDFALLSELNATIETISASITRITLPLELGDILFVEEITDTGTGESVESIYATIKALRSARTSPYASWIDPKRWTFGPTNNVLLYSNGQTFDSTKIRVWYTRHAPKLVRLTVTSYPTTSALRIPINAAPTLGVLSPETDAYRNTWWECITVPSSATPQGKRFFALTWRAGTYPNYDLTLFATHGLTTGSTVWESLPLIPEPHHDLIAHVAAMRALQGAGDQPAAQLVAANVQTLRTEFVNLIEQRQIQTPRYVNYEG